jgi:hypothetical protein
VRFGRSSIARFLQPIWWLLLAESSQSALPESRRSNGEYQGKQPVLGSSRSVPKAEWS